VPLFEVNMCDEQAVRKLFVEEKFDGVIHFAGLKAVGESVAKPRLYYQNNITGTLNVLSAMEASACKVLVFSSSATVYKPSEDLLDEAKDLGCSNPYGWTKFMIEQILMDAVAADSKLAVSILRYFNPVGAHPSGLIGESPLGIPNNLMPYIQQVAVGQREYLAVFGDDYPTPDGTGVRDYIHVDDLAEGHICALTKLLDMGAGCIVHNLGSGCGHSVLEMKAGYEKASGRTIPFKMGDRRPGDLARCVGNPAKAKADFGWETKRTLEDMCASSWNWISRNPNGYEDDPAPKESLSSQGGGSPALRKCDLHLSPTPQRRTSRSASGRACPEGEGGRSSPRYRCP